MEESRYYDDLFFRSRSHGAQNSAKEVLPILKDFFDINSVLDVGCGEGAWLAAWRSLDPEISLCGIDGTYINESQLMIPKENFIPHDIAAPFSLNKKFDLVQCLEVAEHLPMERSESFIHDLTKHGDLIIFSAAPPGQGGLNHINEQPFSFWRTLFEKKGYYPYDIIRPFIKNKKTVQPWYRYNTIVWIKKSREQSIIKKDSFASHYRIDNKKNIEDISPIQYKIRKIIILMLPKNIIDLISKTKTILKLAFRKSRKK